MQADSQKDSLAALVKKPLSLKMFGLGTAGLNVLETLIAAGVPPAECIGLCADQEALAASSANHKILLHPSPDEAGAKLEESLTKILPRAEASRSRTPAVEGCIHNDIDSGNSIANGGASDSDALHPAAEGPCEAAPGTGAAPACDVVFLITGLGGAASTSALPALARFAKDSGALVLAFLTLPFDCEGSHRQGLAHRSLEQLKALVDGVICLPNQKVLKLIDENTSVLETFKLANGLLAEGVHGLWRLLRRSGLIQIHFSDLAALLRNPEAESVCAVAEAAGATRSREAVEKLLAHPMLEGGGSLAEADAVLVSLVSGPDLTMAEVNRVMEQINNHCEHAKVIMGAAIDDSFQDRLALTLIASRCERRHDEPLRMPRCGGEELDTQLLTSGGEARPSSRFIPPAPSLPPDKMEQLLTRQSMTTSRPRKRIAKMRQGQLPLEIVSKGRFDKTDPTIVKGEDLDVPTYVRRRVALN
jgi:cell division protein FtsZ